MNTHTKLTLKRSSNTLLEQAQHGTILKVNRSAFKQYGFASLDNGETIYLPALIINKFNLTEQDVGAGFRCCLRDADMSRPAEQQKKQAMLPFVFDDQSPEVVPVEVPGPSEAEELHAEIDELLARLDKVEEVRGRIDTARAQAETAKAMIGGALETVARLAVALKQAHSQIDDQRVALNAAEQDLQEVRKWVAETYES